MTIRLGSFVRSVFICPKYVLVASAIKTFATQGAAIALISAALSTGMAGARTPAPALGDAAFAAGNFDAATSAYAAALVANSNDADAELGLGTVSIAFRSLLRARALVLAPGSAIARARLDVIEQRTGGRATIRSR